MRSDGYATLLCEWYENNKREMPWRLTNDPYRIWVSEVMLQQTQVETVIPYYHRFIERFPTIELLAGADLQEVLSLWQGLGYYTRAKNLHKGAVYIMEHHEGQFPGEMESIKKIPGIGAYTAGAVLSIAFNKPFPAVDGNVMRVLARQQMIGEDIAKERTKRGFEEMVMSLMGGEPRVFTQALMELGALVCLPRNPQCPACPMNGICKAWQEGVVEAYPIKAKKSASPVEQYYALVLLKDNSVWMEKRSENGLLAGLWGFPLVPLIEPDVFVGKASGKEQKTVRHVFSHRVWEMKPVIFTVKSPNEFDGYLQEKAGKFIPFKELDTLPVASAFRKILSSICPAL